jgi:hypothetical protein
MTLKEKFKQWLDTKPREQIREVQLEVIANDYVIEFTEWKDDNFLMYRDKTYYTKTSSPYFDVTKYIGKEKPTKYYTLKELLEIFKKEKGYGI